MHHHGGLPHESTGPTGLGEVHRGQNVWEWAMRGAFHARNWTFVKQVIPGYLSCRSRYCLHRLE